MCTLMSIEMLTNKNQDITKIWKRHQKNKQ